MDAGAVQTVAGSGQPLLESDDHNTYVYGIGGAPLEQIDTASNTVTWLHHDQIGSTRLLTTSQGVVIGTASYDPYGAPTAITGSTSPLGYGGEYTDNDTGFLYLRARYYDPATGQFTTIDPLVGLTEEPYAYTAGNPLNSTDRSGLAEDFEQYLDSGGDGGEVSDSGDYDGTPKGGDYGAPSILGSPPPGDGDPSAEPVSPKTCGMPPEDGSGQAADNAATSWADASELDRTVDIGGNSVSILGDVSRSGSTVTVDNIALYGTDGELVNQVGGQALRGAGASLLREASGSGVNQVIFRGVRAVNSSGKAGHAVNWIANLGDDGTVSWTLGR